MSPNPNYLHHLVIASRHLFTFKHGKVIIRNGVDPRYKSNPEDGSVVTVEFGGNIPHNDLISCISDSLSKYDSQGSTHDIIIHPSTVITFMLRRNPTAPGATKASPDPFVYPKTIYLDRFLFMNLALTNEKRAAEYKMLEQIRELKAMKNTLTQLEVRILAKVRFSFLIELTSTQNGSDALENLRSTIYYYEKVADPEDDPSRQRTLQQTAEHLKDIMTMISGKVEGDTLFEAVETPYSLIRPLDIDHQIKILQTEVTHIYDCPELQNYQVRVSSTHQPVSELTNIYCLVRFEGCIAAYRTSRKEANIFLCSRYRREMVENGRPRSERGVFKADLQLWIYLKPLHAGTRRSSLDRSYRDSLGCWSIYVILQPAYVRRTPSGASNLA